MLKASPIDTQSELMEKVVDDEVIDGGGDKSVEKSSKIEKSSKAKNAELPDLQR